MLAECFAREVLDAPLRQRDGDEDDREEAAEVVLAEHPHEDVRGGQ